jgi:nucleoside-diphosphate-sugar epimerase
MVQLMNDVSNKKALVTGASGYVGSQLAKRLIADGWQVHVVVRPGSDLKLLSGVKDKLTVHQHDGSTQSLIEIVQHAAPDTVFHLASLFLAQHTTDDVSSLIASNVLFSTQLLEAMAVNDIHKLVNTSTSWQYFENQAHRPVNLYAATKQAFEEILEYYCDARNIQAITLALFDTYGPDDPRKKLIALLWQTQASQKLLELSPGEQKLDMVHIDDVTHAFAQAAERMRHLKVRHERYGISSGEPMRLIDLVAAFEQATGEKVPVKWGGRDYRPREVMVPWNQYARMPGWAPLISFAQGIGMTRPPAS